MPASKAPNAMEGPAPTASGPPAPARVAHQPSEDWGNPRLARNLFLWPALAVVLALAIFPLVASLALAFSHFSFAKGGFKIEWIGLANFATLFSGSEATIFLGRTGSPTLFGYVLLALAILAIGGGLVSYFRGGRVRPVGAIGRIVLGALSLVFAFLVVYTTFSTGGFPGSLVTTMFYATFGAGIEYALGLALAMLTIQRLPGQKFFRVVFLLPMTITPVGVAYMFRMLTDTARGPFAPLWNAAGLSNFALLGDPWGARIAVLIGDVWQWTPFMFIVLVAALEGRDLESEEAGVVDGATRWQIFRHITLPSILPVSATVVFIRLIEAFKIIDLPNVMTNGGPGTATESITLQSYLYWRGFDLGQSAATAYTLLIVVTVVALGYAALVLQRARAGGGPSIREGTLA